MPLGKSPSNSALHPENGDEAPTGPLSGPSSIEWRRQRLLQIGNPSAEATETSSLRPNLETRAASYGTLPSDAHRRGGKQKSNFRTRHGLGALPDLLIPKGRYTNPPTPNVLTPRSLRGSSYFTAQRPITAYDKPVGQETLEPEGAVKTNGIRVWYSSFTSIDWLHDAIKTQHAKHGFVATSRSVAGMRRQLDRSIGWLTVTIIGFLTAVIAFLIVRSEQWLFDIKEGYCTSSIWKAKRFCCPVQDDTLFDLRTPAFVTVALNPEESCPAWRTWGEVFAPMASSKGGLIKQEAIEYAVYTVIAISLAILSALLTIYLTASTSFVTRKDSGVLSSTFATGDDGQKLTDPPAGGAAQRKVLYYAAGSGIPEIKTILSGFVIHGYLGWKDSIHQGSWLGALSRVWPVPW